MSSSSSGAPPRDGEDDGEPAVGAAFATENPFADPTEISGDAADTSGHEGEGDSPKSNADDDDDPDDPFANIAPLDIAPSTTQRKRVQIGDLPDPEVHRAQKGRAGRKRMSVVDALTLEHVKQVDSDEEVDQSFAARGRRRASLAEAVNMMATLSPTNSLMVEKRADIDHATIGRAEFANIQRLFERHDTDESGAIDTKELRQVMLSLGHQLTDEQLGDLMYEITGDKECEALDFEDFVKLILFWKDAARFRLFERETAPQTEHIKAATQTHGMVLPDHPVRRLWDVLMLICLVFLFGTVTFYYCIVGDDVAIERYRRYLIPLESLVASLLVLDTLLGFVTVQMDGRHVVTDPRVIRTTYAKRWLAIDVVSTLPYWLFIPSPAAGYVNWIRVIRFFKLPTMFVTTGRIPMDPSFVTFYYQLLPIIEGLAVFVTFVHLAAVIMIYQQDDRALTLPYGAAIYWALLIISSVGSDIVPMTNDTDGKRWYAMVVMLAGQLVNAVAVGNIVRYFQIADIAAVRAGKLAETAAVCNFFSIPEALSNEILQFQDHVLQHNLSIAYFNLIKGLPNEMKVHIGIYARIRLIQDHPIFSLGHEAVRIAVAQALDAVVYTPEEYVIIAEDVDEDMFVVAHGFLDVLSKRSGFVVTLKPGDHFCEVSLFHDMKHAVSIKTLTYCELFALSGPAFDAVMERFPTFRRCVDQLLEDMERNGSSVDLLCDERRDSHGDGDARPSRLHDLSFLSSARFASLEKRRRSRWSAAGTSPRNAAEQAPDVLMPNAPVTPRKVWNGKSHTPRARGRPSNIEFLPSASDATMVRNVSEAAFRRSQDASQFESSPNLAPSDGGDPAALNPSDSLRGGPAITASHADRSQSTEIDVLGRAFARNKRLDERKRQGRENDMLAIAQGELQRQATGISTFGDTSRVVSPAFEDRGGPSSPSMLSARQSLAVGAEAADFASAVPASMESAAIDAVIAELTTAVEEMAEMIEGRQSEFTPQRQSPGRVAWSETATPFSPVDLGGTMHANALEE